MPILPFEKFNKHDPMHARLRATKYIVEANNYEVHSLWQDYSKQGIDSQSKIHKVPEWKSGQHQIAVDWQGPNDGWMPRIGTLDERPINLSLRWATIDGYLVLFYHPCSQVVDHEVVERWIRNSPLTSHCFPNGADRPGRHTDAMNFAHCVHFIHDCKEAAKFKQGDEVDTLHGQGVVNKVIDDMIVVDLTGDVQRTERASMVTKRS